MDIKIGCFESSQGKARQRCHAHTLLLYWAKRVEVASNSLSTAFITRFFSPLNITPREGWWKWCPAVTKGLVELALLCAILPVIFLSIDLTLVSRVVSLSRSKVSSVQVMLSGEDGGSWLLLVWNAFVCSALWLVAWWMGVEVCSGMKVWFGQFPCVRLLHSHGHWLQHRASPMSSY